MTKKLISLLLALCLLVGLLPAMSFYSEATTYSGTCGENATWSFDAKTGELSISGSGAMKDFSWDNRPWYSYREDIKTVAIGEGITRIGSSAFEFCSNLTSVTIPDSVISIGDWAFSSCYSLTSVTIGNSVTSIGNYVFYDCHDLTSVTIPASVTSIGNMVFYFCYKLTGIWVDKANPNYSSDAKGVLFNKDKTELIQCPGAYSGKYAIPNSVTRICDEAFYYCHNLTSVTIPNSVTFIGESAFFDCLSLKSVTIPASVTSIGYMAFSGCYSLPGIWVAEANPNYSSDAKGVLFNKDKTELIQCPGACSGEYVIPNSVTSIGGMAFSYCDLTSVTISDSVTFIGEDAFFDCKSLKSVTIGNSVTSIGDHAFWCCRSLTSVTIPASVTSIGDNAFSECDNLTSITILNPECDIYSAICTLGKPKTTTIYGYADSTAEAYAVEFGYVFKALGVTATPFRDVKEADYFYTPVLWAVKNSITTGTSATTFSPNDPCTRGQIVTFLWRACGSPEPASNSNPFTDVKTGDYYYKAVIWAVEQGITTGISATKFGPNEACTRGQVATFLWRSQGKPAPTGSNNPFKDVSSSDYYYEAVLWAVENNITQGTGAGKFSPNDSCTRGQIVTFLYRALA